MNLTATVRAALATRCPAIETAITARDLFALADSLRTSDDRASAAVASLAYGDAPAAAAFLGLRSCAGVDDRNMTAPKARLEASNRAA